MYELSGGDAATVMGWKWTNQIQSGLNTMCLLKSHLPAGFWGSSHKKICPPGMCNGLTGILNFGIETADSIMKDEGRTHDFLYTAMTVLISTVREKTRSTYAEEVQDAKQNLTDAQERLQLAHAEQKSNSSGRARFVASEAQNVFRLAHPDEPTEPSESAAFVKDNKSGMNITFQPSSGLITPGFLAATGPSTVSESQTATPAQPPRKQLELGPPTRMNRLRLNLLSLDFLDLFTACIATL
ncbi:hypothetical protein C8R45DRAFT_1223330 [Mycena sanguinolenta]|nr:hypothetical protein C8R45DRAFT_1223330 [Mycena sanguinolenta]